MHLLGLIGDDDVVKLWEEQFETLEGIMQTNIYLLTFMTFILITILVLKR